MNPLQWTTPNWDWQSESLGLEPMVAILCPCIADPDWLLPFQSHWINIGVYNNASRELELHIQTMVIDACYSHVWLAIEEHVLDPLRVRFPQVQCKLYVHKDNAVFQRDNAEHLHVVVDAQYHEGCHYATLILNIQHGVSHSL